LRRRSLFGLFDGMHVGALQVLGDLRAACFLVGHGADHARRGGQAGDRGATQAAVAEGRLSWPAVEPSTPLKGRGTIGRRSSWWIQPSALMDGGGEFLERDLVEAASRVA
jgi:hypothetical protein